MGKGSSSFSSSSLVDGISFRLPPLSFISFVFVESGSNLLEAEPKKGKREWPQTVLCACARMSVWLTESISKGPLLQPYVPNVLHSESKAKNLTYGRVLQGRQCIMLAFEFAFPPTGLEIWRGDGDLFFPLLLFSCREFLRSSPSLCVTFLLGMERAAAFFVHEMLILCGLVNRPKRAFPDHNLALSPP